MTQAYTLLVNSYDGFADCWPPFFTLLTRYWAERSPPVILNTGCEDFAWPGINVTASQVEAHAGRRLSWSECLDAALAQVATPLVLYMQEDYFIEQPVAIERVDAMAARMIADPSIAHIGLTYFGAGRPLLRTPDPDLWKIGRFASYRLSTQAGLWRVETLRSYLQPWENGWMFEIFGTARAWKRPETFLTLARDTGTPAISYQHTGIVKGQWSRFVPALFAREGIAMDFSRRGFYDDSSPAMLRRLRLLGALCRNPTLSARSLLAK